MNGHLKSSTNTWRAVLVGAVMLGCPFAASAGQGSILVGETELSLPSDSHEPQRALVDVRNAGPDRVAGVIVACRFTDGGGSDLQTVSVRVREVAGWATVQASATYYGWPRAARATCNLP